MSSPTLADILTKISEGVCVLDKHRQVTFVNDKASEILETGDDSFHVRIAEALRDGVPMRFEHLRARRRNRNDHRGE